MLNLHEFASVTSSAQFLLAPTCLAGGIWSFSFSLRLSSVDEALKKSFPSLLYCDLVVSLWLRVSLCECVYLKFVLVLKVNGRVVVSDFMSPVRVFECVFLSSMQQFHFFRTDTTKYLLANTVVANLH